jgi:Ca2+/H+ antiporter
MNSRVAYSLAVIILVSPLVVMPSLYFYNLHRQHQLEETVKAHMEALRAKMEAARLARQNH